MSLARGSIIRPVEFSLPQLQLPFEAIASTMQQYQTEKDLFGELQALAPQYLQQDVNEATAYRQFTEDISNQVTNAFTEGNTAEGMRALRLAAQKLRKQWQPGGLANSLNQRYSQYQGALKQIEDHTKDFVDPTYRQYYQHLLDSQVQQGMQFDPASGKFNTIAAPQLVNEVKLGEEVDSFLKGWAADQGYTLEKSPDGFWFHKETNKRVSEEELRGALKNFYNQPHIQYAVGVQAWARAQAIPEEQRPVLLEQAQQQKRAELETAVDQRMRDLQGLEDRVKKGTRAEILAVQKALNEQGYNLTEDGIAGQQTMEALTGYIQDTQAQLEEQKQLIEPAVQGITLESIFKDSYQRSLTDAYVPKYAFTERDLDLIADQVAIARLKISAQKQMMDSLVAQFDRPTATLVTPILAEDITLESTSQSVSRTQKEYSQLERNTASQLPADWQNTFKGMGVNWTNPTQSSSMRRASTAMEVAVRNSQTPAGIDPVRYRETMASQGFNLTPRQLQQQLNLLENPDNLNSLQSLNRRLEPAYTAVEIAGDTHNRIVDAAVASDKVDWLDIGKTILDRAEASATLDAPASSFMTKEQIVEEAKRKVRAGDPAALRAFDQWRRSNNVTDAILGVSTVDVMINESFEPYRDQMMQAAKTNLPSLINFNELDETTRTNLGLDKNGKVMLNKNNEPVAEVTNAQFGVRNVNGRVTPVMLINTNRTTKPVVLSLDQVNRNWAREFLRTAAASTMNPNNPGEIMRPEEFDTYAGMMFDLDQHSGSAFSANQIYRMANNDLSGPIGVSSVQLADRTAEVHSFLIPASGGGQRYLVVSTDPNASSALQRQQSMSPEDLQQLAQSTGVVAVPVSNDYDDVNQSIFTAKSTLMRDVLRNDILSSPFKYTASRNNRTQDAVRIASEILNNDW